MESTQKHFSEISSCNKHPQFKVYHEFGHVAFSGFMKKKVCAIVLDKVEGGAHIQTENDFVATYRRINNNKDEINYLIQDMMMSLAGNLSTTFFLKQSNISGSRTDFFNFCNKYSKMKANREYNENVVSNFLENEIEKIKIDVSAEEEEFLFEYIDNFLTLGNGYYQERFLKEFDSSDEFVLFFYNITKLGFKLLKLTKYEITMAVELNKDKKYLKSQTCILIYKNFEKIFNQKKQKYNLEFI